MKKEIKLENLRQAIGELYNFELKDIISQMSDQELMDSPFEHFGLDSLDVMDLMTTIEQKNDISIHADAIETVMQKNTIRALLEVCNEEQW